MRPQKKIKFQKHFDSSRNQNKLMKLLKSLALLGLAQVWEISETSDSELTVLVDILNTFYIQYFKIDRDNRKLFSQSQIMGMEQAVVLQLFSTMLWLMLLGQPRPLSVSMHTQKQWLSQKLETMSPLASGIGSYIYG